MLKVGFVGNLRNIITSILFFLLVQIVTISVAFAQEEDRDIIQFSGVVTTTDTTSGILGAHIYVPKEGRGTTTNYYGYFYYPLLFTS